ncbi:hypothetical protein [Streptomyces sp. FH025]|uniref:hypothetical protein n=1 Tax=Streptomyces sp. FH025 TaxID=2815937 RepID=UPI001A9FCC13|nr:hypothetical protein [Streptomyces sp. FH025]MBO1416621.1 hypothetical protein [Streptomyces sp. FH025]
MPTTEAPPERALKTPRAAAVAGVLCALILATVIILVRQLPADVVTDTGWLANPSHRDTLNVALELVPFAGIFFLWFMGAIRDRVGAAEDKFFAMLFLGSGLLFVAMLFVLAEAASGLVAAADSAPPTTEPQFWRFGQHLVLTVLASYVTRMAAVFTLSTTTIAQRLGILPRWLCRLGFLCAIFLMFVARSVPWSELLFPAWILAVSGHILLRQLRPRAA